MNAYLQISNDDALDGHTGIVNCLVNYGIAEIGTHTWGYVYTQPLVSLFVRRYTCL